MLGSVLTKAKQKATPSLINPVIQQTEVPEGKIGDLAMMLNSLKKNGSFKKKREQKELRKASEVNPQMADLLNRSRSDSLHT